MKHSHKCPKCDGERIWQIDKLQSLTRDATTRDIRVVQSREAITEERSGLQKLWSGSKDYYTAGYIDLWVCAGCGYTELWSRGLDELQHNPEAGVHLHENQQS